MRKFFLILSISFLSACSTTEIRTNPLDTPPSEMAIYQSSATGLSSIIANNALTSFKNEYMKASENKAFAQSASGAWNWKANRTSVEHAKNSALIACQVYNKKSESMYPCRVINVNGVWVE